MNQKSSMNGGRESDGREVPAKSLNKDGRSSAEGSEGRRPAKENKTRLIEFGRFAVASRKQRGEGKPETFDFLGFTHICGQSRKNGKFLVLRKTMRKRLLKKLNELKEEFRRRWHESVADLGRWLRAWCRATSTIMQYPGILPV
jgi:RNA-directed DNA polymerase